jgi:hypothetical protein
MATARRPQREHVYETLVEDSSRWDRYVPRAGDIIISTPPKAGTTWTQMICALLVFQRTDFDRPLSEISPWFDFRPGDIDQIVSDLDRQTHRRFIKTHTPLDGLPYFEEATYLFCGRDPRDVFLSFLNHWDNTSDALRDQIRVASGIDPSQLEVPTDAQEMFRTWMTVGAAPWMADGFPFGSVFHHAKSFWEFRELSNVHLLHYDDLKADLAGEMRALARRLGVDVDPALWPTLVAAASFESMKADAGRLAPLAERGAWRDNRRFFHRGESGQWREALSPESLALYERIVAERIPPDLAAWIERGTRGVLDPKPAPRLPS